jgi:hypothetical protein
MIGLRPGLQAFRGQAAQAGPTVYEAATVGELPPANGVPAQTIGLVGSAELTTIYRSNGTAWVAERVLAASVGALPSTAAEGAMALVGTSSPLATRLPYVRQSAAWALAGPTIRALSSLTDVLSTDLDNAAATYADPITGVVNLLRLTPAMALPGGGTRRFWLPQDVWSWTGLTCRSYLDGTETMPVTTGQTIQGNTVGWSGASASVTRVSSEIRLASTSAGHFANLQSTHVLQPGDKYYSRTRIRASLAGGVNAALYYLFLDQGTGQPQTILTQNPTFNGGLFVPTNLSLTFVGSNLHILDGGAALPSATPDVLEVRGNGSGTALVDVRRNGRSYVSIRRNAVTGASVTVGQRLIQLLTNASGASTVSLADDVYFTGS